MADFTGASNLASLNGNFKEVYANNIQNIIPEGLRLIKMIPFTSKDKELGNAYHQPVILGHEHGVTFATSSEGAFALNDAVAGQIKDASVDAQQLLLRSVMGYNVAARASKGKNAFIDSTQFLVENMVKSVSKKLEIELLYGSMGIGQVNAATTASTTFVVKLLEWAPGIWTGSEGMKIDVRNAADSGYSVQGAVISSVNLTTRTITLSAATTLEANGVIYFAGAYGKEMSGLHKILSNTGTLFGISASTYSLWASTSHSAASGPLTLAKVQAAIAKGVEKGLDEDVKCLVNPNAWKDLLSDEAALRRHAPMSSKGVEAGAEMITFYSQNGKVEIVPSTYIKEGYAFIIAPKMFKRIGSTDVTFKVPGRDDEFFLHLSSNAGYELRCFTEQALFCEAPGKQVVITAIVNS